MYSTEFMRVLFVFATPIFRNVVQVLILEMEQYKHSLLLDTRTRYKKISKIYQSRRLESFTLAGLTRKCV